MTLRSNQVAGLAAAIAEIRPLPAPADALIHQHFRRHAEIGRADRAFITEGVFPYFEAAQLKTLVMQLRDAFPGAELVFDAHRPWVIKTDNWQLSLSKVKARLRFGISDVNEAIIGDLSPVIGTHGGPGTLGLIYMAGV